MANEKVFHTKESWKELTRHIKEMIKDGEAEVILDKEGAFLKLP